MKMGHVLALALQYALRLTAGLVSLLWFGTLVVHATDRYVTPPGGYGTNDTAGGYTNWLGAATNIQWAVNVAAAGETVWVTNGTYWLTNQISIINGITVRSVNGRDITIVNGNYSAYTNRCFYVSNETAVVDGFTITNGYVNTNSTLGAYGGGVYLTSTGTVQNCIITGNRAYSPVDNAGGVGGGVYMNAGSKVFNCTVSVNYCNTLAGQGWPGYGGGGGIHIASGVVSNCVIFTNWATGGSQVQGGGGVYIRGGTVVNCMIYSNSAYRDGGGAHMDGGWIKNCKIFYNWAGWGGMGVCQYAGTVESCLISTNFGSGMYANYTVCLVRNCTFVKNNTTGIGTYGDVRVENTISYYNNGNNWASIGSTNGLTISNSCINTAAATNFGPGNITNAPLFVNAAADNYRLEKTSPCVNSGTNQSWMTGAVDLDGRMRIRYGIVDMGAYERVHNATFYRFH